MTSVNVNYLTKDNKCSPLESDQTGECTFAITTGKGELVEVFRQKIACTKNQQFQIDIKEPKKDKITKIVTCPSSMTDSSQNIMISAMFNESDDSFSKRIAIQEGSNFFMNQILGPLIVTVIIGIIIFLFVYFKKKGKKKGKK
jgi:hypothetical protein